MSVGEQANIIKDRGTPGPVTGLKPTPFNYSLDEEPLEGFAMAVNNGQVRLALEYAVRALRDFANRLDVLEVEQQTPSMVTTETKSQPTGSSTKKVSRSPAIEQKAESSET